MTYQKSYTGVIFKMSLMLHIHAKHDSMFSVGPTGPSFVAPGLLFSRVVRGHKKYLGKLQMTQNSTARLALGCTQRANNNNVHVNLSWLKVEERLTSSLLILMRGIDMLNAPRFLSINYWHTARTPMHTPQEVSSQSPNPEQTMGGAQQSLLFHKVFFKNLFFLNLILLLASVTWC